MEPGFLLVGLVLVAMGFVSIIFRKQMFELFNNRLSKKHMKPFGGGLVSNNDGHPMLVAVTGGAGILLGVFVLIAGIMQ